MYRQCTTAKTAAQQKIFLDALYQAMHEQPYADISITDLCLQTGLSRNIFYRLFGCKDDVLYALIDNLLFECAKEFQETQSKETCLTFYSFWKDRKNFLDILNKNRMESILFIRGSVCCSQINLGLSNLSKNNWNNYDVEILSFYASGFIGLLFHWYHDNFSRSVEEMAELTYKLIHTQPPSSTH